MLAVLPRVFAAVRKWTRFKFNMRPRWRHLAAPPMARPPEIRAGRTIPSTLSRRNRHSPLITGALRNRREP